MQRINSLIAGLLNYEQPHRSAPSQQGQHLVTEELH